MIVELILAVAPVGPAVTNNTGGGDVGGASLFWPLLFLIVVLYAVYRLLGMNQDDKGPPKNPGEGPGWNWPQWGGPHDWPALPKTPKGTGPVPDYVPDEWVFEEFGHPPRLLVPLTPKDES